MVNNHFLNEILTKYHLSKENENGILYNCIDAEEMIYLENESDYYLFFLLEGEVSLGSNEVETIVLQEKEFILLSSYHTIQCIAHSKSRYVIINCNQLKNPGNMIYLKNIQQCEQHALDFHPAYTPLPIHYQLDKIIQNWLFYTNNEFNYSSMCDTILIILRSIYTDQDMTTLLYPWIKKENKLNS